MKNKAVSFCNLALGLLYIATTVWGYSIAFPMKEYIHLAEWCCISGLLGGTFYLFAFIYEFVTKKRLNAIFYLNTAVVLSLILIATIIMQLNVDEAFVFIHIVNPILILIYFFVFCDCSENKKILSVITCITFPIFYILFALCVWQSSGQCPFPASLILVWDNVLIPIGIIFGLCALIIGLSFGFFYLNRLIRKLISKK